MPKKTRTAWELLSAEVAFEAGPFLTVVRESVRTPSGRVVDDYYRIVLPDFVVVHVETENGLIVCLEQEKRAVGRASLTLPGGVVNSREDRLAAARRELLEETGYEADDWVHLGSFIVNGNQGCGTGHFYKAAKARPVAEADSGDLETMEIRLVDKTELLSAVKDGRVALMNHAACIAMASMT